MIQNNLLLLYIKQLSKDIDRKDKYFVKGFQCPVINTASIQNTFIYFRN